MKPVSIVLSIYILALAIVPCCFYDNCPEDKPIAEQTTKHKSGDEDGCGTCSPFFSCEGCAANIINYEPITFNLQVPGIKLNHSSFSQQFISYNFSLIWQPPQLS